MSLDVDVQTHARTLTLNSPDHVRVGRFAIRYNPDWSLKYANYAIPDQDADPTPGELDDLIAAFRDLDRMPRLEYLPGWAPALEPALLAAGFTVENRAPILACAPGDLVTPKPVAGLVMAEPATDAEFDAAALVQHLGYGGTGEPEDGTAGWLRDAVAGGGVAALATVDGTPAGAGGCSVPVDGLSELAGLAVGAEFRRRGIGAALSVHLTRTAFERGCRVVWLEPGDPDVERIYASIGYRRVGEKLNISLDPA
ncbi:GNAT family N-acetyltransferase [Streptomyces sp. A0958]|uniref:GNAT family N-acetyltransferase n=1 Tax=Streptomyces sp. A0958 TaxID=2563101 RepID=UPI00109ED2F7|nr:GNAT family N-acetyltransferase [Streptomyces sp. A0958]THA69217.1 GNAT family N-acetyltransferase [Streptomyces sp. A0958]